MNNFQPPSKTELFADYKINSLEHHSLIAEYTHPKIGVIVQTIEYLIRRHGYPAIGGLYLNIFPPNSHCDLRHL